MPGVPSAGEMLAGKYRVERVLGEGGMGVVVAAEHIGLGQRVAIKLLHAGSGADPQAVARFVREARAAVQIQNEHVARVSDVGALESGEPYIVMELLQGADLGDTLRLRGPLPVAEAVGWVLEAAEAVAEAHALGIVHRDLKPANLFLAERRDGSRIVKVLDFGISKAPKHGDDGLSSGATTATGVIMGSPLYMSPEQVRSTKDIDARTDIWALGVIVQELLSGASPFRAETMSAVMAAIVADPPVPLRALRPDAPVALERVILRCLEKDRTKRFANVAELARALEPFGPPSARESVERIARVLGAPATASAAGIATTAFAANPVPGAGSAVGWGRTETSSRRSRPVLTISVVALLLAAGAVAGVSLLKGGATADASASAGTSPAPPPATESATVAMGAASAAAAPSPPVPVAPSASLPVSPEPPARDQAARRSAPPRRTSATLRASAAPPATVAAPPATPELRTPQPGPATTAPAPQSRPKAPASGVWDDMK